MLDEIHGAERYVGPVAGERVEHQPARVRRVGGTGAGHVAQIAQSPQPALTEDFGGAGVRRLAEYPQHPPTGVGDR